MSRKSVVFAALIASGFAFVSAQADESAVFSGAGQLTSGKTMLSEGGIAGLTGKTPGDATMAVKTVTYSGGDLFSTSLTDGAKLATPETAAKFAAFSTKAGMGGSLMKGLKAREDLLSVTK